MNCLIIVKLNNVNLITILYQCFLLQAQLKLRSMSDPSLNALGTVSEMVWHFNWIVICEHKSNSRELRVVKLVGGGLEVSYLLGYVAPVFVILLSGWPTGWRARQKTSVRARVSNLRLSESLLGTITRGSGHGPSQKRGLSVSVDYCTCNSVLIWYIYF